MCTNITLKSNNKVVAARTNEFSYIMDSKFKSFPRGMKFNGFACNASKGLKWENKYGFVGIVVDDLIGDNLTIDGMNEEGLAVQLLYFPGYAKYQKVDKSEDSITYVTFSNYVLSNFKSVEEVKEGLKKIHIESEIAKDGKEEPCHFQINDKLGNAIVVEVEDEKIKIHENPMGVMTNSPGLQFHLTNIANYTNLSCMQVNNDGFGIGSKKAFGMGSGAIGMPGDNTPPSRFIRAAFYSQNAVYDDNSIVDVAFRILNNFDLVDGSTCVQAQKAMIEKTPDRFIVKGENLVSDITLYTVVKELTEGKVYYKDHYNNTIRVIDCNKIDFSKGANQMTVELYNDLAPKYVDITSEMK